MRRILHSKIQKFYPQVVLYLYSGNISTLKTSKSRRSQFITALGTHSEGKKIAKKLEDCGEIAMGVECNNCGYPHPIPLSCDLRICPVCSKKIRTKAVEKRKKRLSNMKNPKSMTLTVRNIDGPVKKEDVDFIRDSYTKLRRRKPYKHKIEGSFYGIEPKHKMGDSEEEGFFIESESKFKAEEDLVTNLHLHTLVDMKYHRDACKEMKKANIDGEHPEEEEKIEKEKCPTCQKDCLRRDWKDITGCPVVDIRDVRSSEARKKALFYAAGYIGKGDRKYIDESITDPYVLGVVLFIIVTVLENVRMIQATGNMLKGPLLKTRFECPICGAVSWSLPFMWTEDHVNKSYRMRRESAILANAPPETENSKEGR